MALLRKTTTRNEGFIKKIEDFISEGTGHRWGRLSPAELYSFYYEFNCTPVITKRTKLVQIGLQDLYDTFVGGTDPNVLMIHETRGLLHPMDGVICYQKANREKFDVSDLLSTLNKRVTFFVGTLKKKSDVGSSDDIFEVREIQMYIPYEKDTMLHVDSDSFEKTTLEYWREKPAACSIQYIYQNGAVLPEEKMIPDFNKEFFVFTTLNIHKATVVINYNP